MTRLHQWPGHRVGPRGLPRAGRVAGTRRLRDRVDACSKRGVRRGPKDRRFRRCPERTAIGKRIKHVRIGVLKSFTWIAEERLAPRIQEFLSKKGIFCCSIVFVCLCQTLSICSYLLMLPERSVEEINVGGANTPNDSKKSFGVWPWGIL